MINVNVLSQQDPRWANQWIGSSYSRIGDYGCTITCIAMLAGESNVGHVDDLLTVNQGYVNGDWLVWGNVPKSLPNLTFVERGWSYDNTKVKNWIAKGFPVIVQVGAGPIGSPRTDHYVLYLGDQKLADPWTGRIRPTSDFPDVKGYALYESKALVDQYAKKLTTLKIAVDRLKSELDVAYGNANKEATYNDTISKVKKIYETGTL